MTSAKFALYEWKYDDCTAEGTAMRFAFLDTKSRRVLIQRNCGGEAPHPTWIPVFLGTDVLHFNASETQSNSNTCRVHGRYGKVGLACKLTFPTAHRPRGIAGGTNMYWFYSVQGIFKLANDLGTRELQLECYSNFLKLWRDRFNDGLLMSDIEVVDVVAERDSHMDETLPVASRKPIVGGIAQPLIVRKNGEHGAVQALGVEIPTTVMRPPAASRPLTSLEWLMHTCHAGTSSSCGGLPLCLSLIDSLHDYCDVSHAGWQSWETGFDTQILCGVATWLGEQLRLLGHTTRQRVEKFKSREIYKRENILDCREFLTDLFHPTMIILLARWMGIVQIGDRRNKWPTDQDFGTSPKCHRSANTSRVLADSGDEIFWNAIDKTQEYRLPVLQTALEFITGSLISGKAMVLYSFVVPNETDKQYQEPN